MADFRKWFMVVAVVLLATATAFASSSTVKCQSSAQTQILRDVGITEYVGDIDLTCDSTLVPAGVGAMTGNFTVFFNATVTNAIDDDNMTMAGAAVQRSLQPHKIYSTTRGMVTSVFPNTGNGLFFANVTVPAGTTFQIRFFNMRVSAATAFNKPANDLGQSEIIAAVNEQGSQINGFDISYGDQVPSAIVVATIQPTLKFSVTDCVGKSPSLPIALQECVAYGLNAPSFPGVQPAQVFGVTFQEAVPPSANEWAFKNLVDEDGATVPDFIVTSFANNGPVGDQTQICDTRDLGTSNIFGPVPGDIPPTPPCNNHPWLSNGTRLLASWTLGSQAAGVPTLVGKVHLWVTAFPTNITPGAMAVLKWIDSPDGWTGTAGIPQSGPSVRCDGNGPGGNYRVKMPDNVAVEYATWEVTSEANASPDVLTFGWAITYDEYELPSLPAGAAYPQIKINGQIAPISTDYQAELLTVAPVVRFVPQDNTSPVTVQIDHCVTNLLFPYVTNAFINANIGGYQTGIAISNTSLDSAWNAPVKPTSDPDPLWGASTDPMPYNTTPQAGTCNLFLFGSNTPASAAGGAGSAVETWAVATVNVQAGQTFADTIDNIYGLNNAVAAKTMTGYLIARCNFQFGHGLAFIVAPGTGSTQDYLALVIPDRNILNADTAKGAGFITTPIRIAKPFSDATFDEQGEVLAQ